ncbi:MAG: hypothetical protein A3I07_03055 [Candidatus Doudnabacteria bacterium RIFCSPLOWO2_02_FULL_42_9]|uniref:Ribulose-phosphate 3-epimerase n=1 Tax=Candidatus Doudnabacteria bacterium RIFCSPHIGHO2_01_FULL_41_86 TaxID=1817821 RepID=A0A1F5N9A5_9BACT|nr:MAG: hypothetical protein A2717_01555 [Candidatus Doudnabacteria bacterium RIFCSPHIGHO2_01_FULL_41_86]OGE75039.1 MAG: hypothetical protein A3K07_04695 [Candidatus Doudnabacteria bacterium RIFCSPHIGHO2_01_43_10]OGE85254.1 MAG: hypothetical protein A3E28_01125 [Candidatus Doudnabacteria bacterium RIFCSPHIGHO2_12_FULL_42_22]OGE86792.1 MAG: hypothetical protein A3C49_01960 [Candidatus Doudnabacteria bacterium RIFCSPHIGHO2_02_FULL_42_25]OGE92391.1 MAG: hypothetical protein A2895_02115 [Candidatus
MTELAPAILTNDISDFRKKYSDLFGLSQYFRILHVDFMDDVFVDRTTVMPDALDFLKSSPLILMAHFMTMMPQQYFEKAKEIGFKQVIFHYEAVDEPDMDQVIAHGKNLGFQIGIAINPETAVHRLGKYLQKVDMVQVMGIHPGAQGREFIPSIIDKVEELRSLSKTLIIVVDGGVKVGVAHDVAEAGANIIVAGSSILQSPNEQEALESLRKDIEL